MRVSSVVAGSTVIVLVLAAENGLGQTPPQPASPRTDTLGDPLPVDALLRLGTSRFRHGQEIYSLAFSADGRRIVTGNAGLTRLLDSASVIVWDADTGKPLRRWNGHAHVVRSVAISADNKHVAVVNGYGQVVLYDLAGDGKPRRLKATSPERVLFTPDARTLLVADKNHVRRWDLARDQESEPLRGHTDSIFGLCVAADGKTFATCACDGTVRLWDSAGTERRCLKLPKKYGLGVALSTDGARLACGTFEEEIRVWETATGRELWQVNTPDYRVSAQSFSPDGATLATGVYRLRLWDSATGKEIRVIDCGQGLAARHVAFSPDGKRIATAGAQATLSLWDPATGKGVLAYDGHHHGVSAGSFAPDGGTLATVSHEPFVRLWDLNTGKARRFALGQGNIHSVAYAPDGMALATSGSVNDWPELWELSSGRRLRRFVPKEGELAGGRVVFSEGELAGGRVVFSGDGQTLLSSTVNRNIRFWEAGTGRELPERFAGSASPIDSSLFYHYVTFVLSPDGKTVATTRGAYAGSGVILWDRGTGEERLKLADRGEPAAFTPDGRLVAVLDETEVLLLDTVRGKEVRRMKGGGRLTCAAFSRDGKTLAAAGEDLVVSLWETVTGQRRRQLRGHQDTINFVTFAPDGLRLASGGEDHMVLLWDLTGRAP
jgi:WD40 repeat protein